MKPKVVVVPSLKSIIQSSPGFKKKELSTKKVDLMTICGFGCLYCSSNESRYLNANWVKGVNYSGLMKEQLGKDVTKADLHTATLEWKGVIPQLEKELKNIKNRKTSKGKTLVFSELTDGFSPNLVKDGITRKSLELLLKYTDYRIRILTKSAIIGKKDWVEFFKDNKERFLVGLSIGTLDNKWTKDIELGTSNPTKRMEALNSLQDAGVPTYGMLCPVFPDLLLEGNQLEDLIDKINPTLDSVEEVFAEPYNDRSNWKDVRKGFKKDSNAYKWMTNVYEYRRMDIWSKYATELYLRIRKKAEAENWIHKLKYLLYEGEITESDAKKFTDQKGVLLQGPRDKDDKLTKHFIFAKNQLDTNCDKDLLQELDKLHSNIGDSLEKFKTAWIELALNIKAVKDKMILIGGTKKEWRTYWGVEGIEDYCKRYWNISKTTYYDMLNAIDFIEETKPQLLTEYEKNKDLYIPSYSKLFPIARAKNEQSKTKLKNDKLVIEMFYDKNVGRTKLGQNIKKIHGKEIYKKPDFTSEDYINRVKSVLEEQCPDESEKVNKIIKDLNNLFKK